MNLEEFQTFFHSGTATAYAWPGGYPLYFITSDGGVLCPACVTKERALIEAAINEDLTDGWKVEAADNQLRRPRALTATTAPNASSRLTPRTKGPNESNPR